MKARLLPSNGTREMTSSIIVSLHSPRKAWRVVSYFAMMTAILPQLGRTRSSSQKMLSVYLPYTAVERCD